MPSDTEQKDFDEEVDHYFITEGVDYEIGETS
jgi:hypothetical protein